MIGAQPVLFRDPGDRQEVPGHASGGECRTGAGRGMAAHAAWLTLKWVVFPPLFYFLCFCLLTYPALSCFSTHYFHAGGDGWQNVWNLWWVNRAVTELHQDYWATHYLHYPVGVSLYNHTLTPFNGLLGVPLLRSLTLLQTYNALVVFSFVSGGVTALVLAYAFVRAYWPALAAGFLFTFSSYHFAHAAGHLQLLSLEWLPLAVLCLHRLITRPGPLTAAGAAAALYLVILCDYYYFLFAVLTGALAVVTQCVRRRSLLACCTRRHLLCFALCGVLVTATSGVLVRRVLALAGREPCLGAHDPRAWSLDVIALAVPGGNWRFAAWTAPAWSVQPAPSEASVHLGLANLALLAYVWRQRRRLPRARVTYLFVLFAVFWVLALGPCWRVWNRQVLAAVTPYGVLERLVPPLKLSGMPVRWVLMSVLASSVLSAFGIKLLLEARSRTRWTLAPLLGLLLFETLPAALPTSAAPAPGYVAFLRDLPGHDGTIDQLTDPAVAMYWQTVHQKPLLHCYISRLPYSVCLTAANAEMLLAQGQFGRVRQLYGYRYLVTPRAIYHPGARVIYDDGDAVVHELLEPDTVGPRWDAVAHGGEPESVAHP